jgi:hypothetical protein
MLDLVKLQHRMRHVGEWQKRFALHAVIRTANSIAQFLCHAISRELRRAYGAGSPES